MRPPVIRTVSFVRYIERLKKFDTDFKEAATAGEQDNTVRIMTSIRARPGVLVVFLPNGKRFVILQAGRLARILLDGTGVW